MSEMTEYRPGTFCWPELVEEDSDRAKEFYSNLLGWNIADVTIGNDRVYSMASVKGKEVGALYEMLPEQRENGVPTHWRSYVPVADIDEAAKKV